MNYEQKYKEALERARKLATDLPNGRADRLYHVSDLEAIFPELKESEDKRIKRCIGICLTDANEQRFNEYNTTLKGCLAWLEKQGEQDALKSLPKWKKMPNGIQGNGDFKPTYLVRTSNGHYFTTPCLSWDEDSMYIELSELEKLPKED